MRLYPERWDAEDLLSYNDIKELYPEYSKDEVLSEYAYYLMAHKEKK